MTEGNGLIFCPETGEWLHPGCRKRSDFAYGINDSKEVSLQVLTT